MEMDACLIDTNILLRWVKPDDRDDRTVNAAVEILFTQRVKLCYTSHNLAEFWNTCTRPIKRNGFGLGIPDADLRARLIESRLNLLSDAPAVHNEWRRLIVAHEVSGVQVHDARLVAAMKVYRVRNILTFNQRDFRRYTDVQALHPQALSQPGR